MTRAARTAIRTRAFGAQRRMLGLRRLAGGVSFGAWLTAVPALLVLATAPARAQDLFVAGGRLVDPRAQEVVETGLLIVDGVIRATMPEPPAGFAGEILDAEGRWVIPGLHDLHVHSLLNQAPGGVREIVGSEVVARRMLYAGVTGFLDLFNEEDYVLELRDRLRAGADSATADVFAAGPCLTATGGHCTEYPAPTRTIDTPEQARREIAELSPKRPDVIKLVYDARPLPTIDPATLEAAVAAAREHGLPTVVHVGSWDEARTAAEAGATAITHLDADDPIPPDLPALLAERGTLYIPTLAIYAGLLDLGGADGRAARSPLLQAVASQEIVAAYRSYDPSVGRLYQFLTEARPNVYDAVRKLAAAGVPLVTGTDSGNWGTVHGDSLHHELALMVDAGLTPWQALAASTTTAGRLLGRSWGLSPGDEGSVVVLEASPIEDIRNTTRIAAVVHHGLVVDREELAAAMFPSLLSREIVAVVWAHLQPRHLVALAVLVALVGGGAFGVRRLVRRLRRPRT